MTNTPEGSAMSEPVAYKIVPINMVTTSENERDKWIKAGHEVEALYPASVVEALKAENEALQKTLANVADVIGCQSALDKLEIVDRITSALVPPKKGDSK